MPKLEVRWPATGIFIVPRVSPNVSIPPQLKAIAYCESHGNPRAVSSTGKFRGLFQFDYRTWATVGGKGDPAAASATG